MEYYIVGTQDQKDDEKMLGFEVKKRRGERQVTLPNLFLFKAGVVDAVKK
jgi:hypothetical protein